MLVSSRIHIKLATHAESDARKKKSSKPKAVDSGDDSDEFDPKRRVPAPDDDDDEDEFSFAKVCFTCCSERTCV